MTTLLDELGELLRYPSADYLSRLDRACAESEPDESRALLEQFRAQAAAMSLEELQELYTRTFDLSPLCSLEAGWQLYGEDYARGSFLVYMSIEAARAWARRTRRTARSSVQSVAAARPHAGRASR